MTRTVQFSTYWYLVSSLLVSTESVVAGTGASGGRICLCLSSEIVFAYQVNMVMLETSHFVSFKKLLFDSESNLLFLVSEGNAQKADFILHVEQRTKSIVRNSFERHAYYLESSATA